MFMPIASFKLWYVPECVHTCFIPNSPLLIFLYSAQNGESQGKHATPINCASHYGRLTDQKVTEGTTPNQNKALNQTLIAPPHLPYLPHLPHLHPNTRQINACLKIPKIYIAHIMHFVLFSSRVLLRDLAKCWRSFLSECPSMRKVQKCLGKNIQAGKRKKNARV